MQRFREYLDSLGMHKAEDVLSGVNGPGSAAGPGSADGPRGPGSADGSRVVYAGMVICRQRPSTAGGIVFVTLEDESGFINLILRNSVFEAFRALVVGSSVLGVEGKIQRADGVVHILVERCFDPFRLHKTENTSARAQAALPQEYIGKDGQPVRVQSRDFQ